MAAPFAGPVPAQATLGDQRFISLSALVGTVNASLAPVNPGVNDDFMVFSAMAGSSGRFTLTVGAAANLNANFLDIPLPMMGGDSGNDWDRVRLSFDATQMSSLASITVTLTSSTAGGSASVTQAFAGGGGDVDFLHSAFTLNNAAFTDAAFRDIDMATFTLTGVDGGVYDISSFDRNGFVVPEPSTYALLAVGLAGAVMMARRRRANATA